MSGPHVECVEGDDQTRVCDDRGVVTSSDLQMVARVYEHELERAWAPRG